ncbi:MAG: hypothetical protein XD90_0955 [Methanobacterium sp. 42_16]|nr:MAG: hypothetical protein XD90_0955 [Methanobacterium sp. 42_16]
MGHKFKDGVGMDSTYQTPDELRKSYLRCIDYLNVKSSPVIYSMYAIRENGV